MTFRQGSPQEGLVQRQTYLYTDPCNTWDTSQTYHHARSRSPSIYSTAGPKGSEYRVSVLWVEGPRTRVTRDPP